MKKKYYIRPTKRRQSYQKVFYWILAFTIFIILALVILWGAKRSSMPELTSTWQSDETGVILTFTKEGEVIFSEELPSGSYHIISPTSMEYTIKNQTFLMYYEIKERTLYWGMDQAHLESFHLK